MEFRKETSCQSSRFRSFLKNGLATIYQLADGGRVLRFEDFNVLNGPELHVWLVGENPVPNTVGTEPDVYYDLGNLKGNIGDQNYEIPEGLDLSEYNSVVILP